ncbi:MAG: hypothetical protein Q4B12_08080 [Bowdeniella nasicola]|nr:hypothetical protein [Bowdeniella nasicola]
MSRTMHRIEIASVLKDPRFLIGVLLVIGAVALGTWLVQRADERVPVWAASEPLTPGTPLTGHVTTVSVHPDVAHLYLPATQPADGTATRSIGSGELIARTAISTDAPEAPTRSVVIPLGTALPTNAGRGYSVDIWLVPQSTVHKDDVEPRILTAGAIIEKVHTADSPLASNHGAIEVAVPAEDVSAVLAGLADQGLLTVVPQGGRL